MIAAVVFALDVTAIGFAIIHMAVRLLAFLIGLSFVVAVGVFALYVLLFVVALPMIALGKVMDWVQR